MKQKYICDTIKFRRFWIFFTYAEECNGIMERVPHSKQDDGGYLYQCEKCRVIQVGK